MQRGPDFHSSQTIIADAPTSIYGDGGGGTSAAHPIAPSHRRQILSDSAAAAVSDHHDEMALLGGRCVADADCEARGSVCGREHGRCECGRGTGFDIATQECRGELQSARFTQPPIEQKDLFLIARMRASAAEVQAVVAGVGALAAQPAAAESHLEVAAIPARKKMPEGKIDLPKIAA